MTDSGVRAGSTLTQNIALLNLLKFTGKTLEEILPLFTENPAKMLGIFDRIGSIADGKDSDLVIMDENNRIKKVFIKGKLI